MEQKFTSNGVMSLTIGICTKHRLDKFCETVRSLRHAYEVSCRQVEIHLVVVDTGSSTKDYKEKVKFLLQLDKEIKQKEGTDKGLGWIYNIQQHVVPLGVARDYCIRKAETEYTCLFDDDDIFGSNFLVEFLKAALWEPDLMVYNMLSNEKSYEALKNKFNIENERFDKEITPHLWKSGEIVMNYPKDKTHGVIGANYSIFRTQRYLEMVRDIPETIFAYDRFEEMSTYYGLILTSNRIINLNSALAYRSRGDDSMVLSHMSRPEEMVPYFEAHCWNILMTCYALEIEPKLVIEAFLSNFIQYFKIHKSVGFRRKLLSTPKVKEIVNLLNIKITK